MRHPRKVINLVPGLKVWVFKGWDYSVRKQFADRTHNEDYIHICGLKVKPTPRRTETSWMKRSWRFHRRLALCLGKSSCCFGRHNLESLISSNWSNHNCWKAARRWVLEHLFADEHDMWHGSGSRRETLALSHVKTRERWFKDRQQLPGWPSSEKRCWEAFLKIKSFL